MSFAIPPSQRGSNSDGNENGNYQDQNVPLAQQGLLLLVVRLSFDITIVWVIRIIVVWEGSRHVLKFDVVLATAGCGRTEGVH
jgi:hypothetical protein